MCKTQPTECALLSAIYTEQCTRFKRQSATHNVQNTHCNVRRTDGSGQCVELKIQGTKSNVQSVTCKLYCAKLKVQCPKCSVRSRTCILYFVCCTLRHCTLTKPMTKPLPHSSQHVQPCNEISKGPPMFTRQENPFGCVCWC